jgi:hypothetical protein
MLSRRMKKLITVTLVLVLIVLAAWGLIRMLPQGFSTDLSLVGAGERAVVLVHDHNFVESVELMEALDGVRQRHPEAMHYLVADLNTPRGTRFADLYDVDAVTLILFDQHGNRVATLRGRQGRDEVEAWLQDNLPPY